MHETALLGFQCGGENRSIQILCQISRGNPHRPITRAPFGQLVIGQRPRGHGVHRLALGFAHIGPQLKNQCFARTGGRVHHHILPRLQRPHRLLLPEIRNSHRIEHCKGIG